MKRHKVLLGPALIIIILSLLTISAKNSVTADLDILGPEVIKEQISQPNAGEKLIYDKKKQELLAAIENYFKQALDKGLIVGAGVSIIKDDSIVIAEGFGEREFGKGNKVDGQSIFRLGSLSKGFTGILAASLVEENKINWSDKIQDYIPAFQLGSKSNTDEVTLASILSHSSGTAYHSYTDLVEAGLPMADIATLFRKIQPISKPGEIYSYQNAIFALSSEVMKKATGLEINDILHEKLFRPLQMNTASSDFESLIKEENIAYPHKERRYGYREIKLTDKYFNAVAAGGINASSLDMGKWMLYLLGKNKALTLPTAAQEVFNPQIEIKGTNKYYQRWPGHIASYYGFGWRIHKYLDEVDQTEKTILHHGGSVNSYRNEIAVYPEDDLGICVLFNSNSKLAKTVIPDLHKIVKEIYENPSETEGKPLLAKK